MTDLLARLESAPCDDPVLFEELGQWAERNIEGFSLFRWHELCGVKAFMEAALILVPEGDEIWWEVRQMCSLRSPMRDGEGIFSARAGLHYGADGYLGRSDYPALALCIAALKAREVAG